MRLSPLLLWPVCVVVLVSLSTQAQSPRPKEKASSANENKDRPRDSTGITVTGPFTQIGTVTEATQPQQKAKDWHEWFWPPMWSNWALVGIGLTAAIAAFRTLGVIRRQTVVLERQTTAIERQVTSSQITADAAKISADAAKEEITFATRPKLALRFISTESVEGPRMEIAGSFRITNTGQSDATLKTRYFEIFVGTHPPSVTSLPDKFGKTFVDMILPPGRSIGDGYPTEGTFTLTGEQYMALRSRKEYPEQGGQSLFLIGWIDYSYAGKGRRVGYCRRYNLKTKRFVKHPHPDYEYGDQG